MAAPIIRHFSYDHLPPNLKVVSQPVGDIAHLMDTILPDCAEKSAGLRKLLEAKDCFVRAELERHAPPPASFRLQKLAMEGLAQKSTEPMDPTGEKGSLSS